ncbi:MAG: hypothetical protein RLN70_07440 [Rhodospirillaceae bacterium]
MTHHVIPLRGAKFGAFSSTPARFGGQDAPPPQSVKTGRNPFVQQTRNQLSAEKALSLSVALRYMAARAAPTRP